MTNNTTTICNAMTLATSYAIYLANNSSRQRDKFLYLALDLVYMAHDSVKSLSIKTLENVANNRLLIEVGEKLKNNKENEFSS